MISWFHDLSDTLKHWIDALSIGVVVATFMSALPTIGVVLSIVWTLLRIYESNTVTSVLKKMRDRRAQSKSPTNSSEV